MYRCMCGCISGRGKGEGELGSTVLASLMMALIKCIQFIFSREIFCKNSLAKSYLNAYSVRLPPVSIHI